VYGKVYSLGDRFKYLHANLPHLIVFDPVFDETLCEVPIDEVTQHFKPTEKLMDLRSAKNLSVLEEKALHLAEDLKAQANISWSSLGISGSILAGLTAEKSDIDPIVYGLENCTKAYIALQELLKDPASNFKPYTKTELLELFKFRSKDTQMSFEDFQHIETRKAFQGKYLGTDYFVRFLKDYSEVQEQYGDVRFKNNGYAKISAAIADASDSLFTPCNYKLKNVKVLKGSKLSPLDEIASFRGRFCMQAIVSEKIVAQGKVELVTNKQDSTQYYRLILGNKPEDHMILKD
jgi:uncharacterized protein